MTERFEQLRLEDCVLQSFEVRATQSDALLTFDRVSVPTVDGDHVATYTPARIRFHSVQSLSFDGPYALNATVVDIQTRERPEAGVVDFQLQLAGGLTQDAFMVTLTICARSFELEIAGQPDVAEHEYPVVVEPRGRELRLLLLALRPYARFAQLRWRDERNLEAAAHELVTRLESLGMTRDREYSWRGIVEPHGDVTRARFPFSDEIVELLCNTADGLYDWIEPMRPEDLTLLREDRTPLLRSVAHEQKASLFLTRDELRALADRVANLERLIDVT